MRVSIAALARIRRGSGAPEFLFQWNDNWSCFSLPGGHKQADESFSECVHREIEEELGLVRGRDFQVAPNCVGRLEYTALSRSADAETRYTLELFDVELAPEVADRVADNSGNRWLTLDEIQRGTTADGRPISEAARRCFPNTNIHHIEKEPHS